MMNWHAGGFDWDRGNKAKCQKHGLSVSDIEGLFMRPIAILPDAAHSRDEHRFRAFGQTEEGRRVFLVFTLRSKGAEVLIRPISARYMHKREIDAYEKENSNL
jgi:uncharacterized DUF497 family protein